MKGKVRFFFGRQTVAEGGKGPEGAGRARA